MEVVSGILGYRFVALNKSRLAVVCLLCRFRDLYIQVGGQRHLRHGVAYEQMLKARNMKLTAVDKCKDVTETSFIARSVALEFKLRRLFSLQYFAVEDSRPCEKGVRKHWYVQVRSVSWRINQDTLTPHIDEPHRRPDDCKW